MWLYIRCGVRTPLRLAELTFSDILLSQGVKGKVKSFVLNESSVGKKKSELYASIMFLSQG